MWLGHMIHLLIHLLAHSSMDSPPHAAFPGNLTSGRPCTVTWCDTLCDPEVCGGQAAALPTGMVLSINCVLSLWTQSPLRA